MKYDAPELRRRLAAEYVLGTLRGRARRRFERLLMEDPWLHQEVFQWERRLSPLGAGLEPVAPPRRVLRRILRDMRARRAVAGRRTRFWQAWSLGATAAAVALAVFIGMGTPGLAPPAKAPYVAIFQEGDRTLWVLSADRRTSRLFVNAVGVRPAEQGRVFELWMLPEGDPPVSLGILPAAGRVRLPLSAEILSILSRAKGLAVSLEPPGGSPTGRPTGPVVHQTGLYPT